MPAKSAGKVSGKSAKTAAPKASAHKAPSKAPAKGGAIKSLKTILGLDKSANGKKTNIKPEPKAAAKSAKTAAPKGKPSKLAAPAAAAKTAAPGKPGKPGKTVAKGAPAAPAKGTSVAQTKGTKAAAPAAPALTPKEAKKLAKQQAAEAAARGKKGKEQAANQTAAHIAEAGAPVCREVACELMATTGGYCRMHYIKNWKKVKRKEMILKEKKLNHYIEELVSKYPDKYIEAIRQDLASEKDFSKVIADLEIEEGVDDFESVETESAEGIIDNLKRDFDDDGDVF